MVWVGRTLKATPCPSPCHGQRCHSLPQASPSPVPPGPGWDSQSLSGQPVQDILASLGEAVTCRCEGGDGTTWTSLAPRTGPRAVTNSSSAAEECAVPALPVESWVKWRLGAPSELCTAAWMLFFLHLLRRPDQQRALHVHA